jgi:hypothetical protein
MLFALYLLSSSVYTLLLREYSKGATQALYFPLHYGECLLMLPKSKRSFSVEYAALRRVAIIKSLHYIRGRLCGFHGRLLTTPVFCPNPEEIVDADYLPTGPPTIWAST